LLALCALAWGMVLALGWAALVGPGEMAAPIRVAVPVVACVASVVFLRRLPSGPLGDRAGGDQ